MKIRDKVVVVKYLDPLIVGLKGEVVDFDLPYIRVILKLNNTASLSMLFVEDEIAIIACPCGISKSDCTYHKGV